MWRNPVHFYRDPYYLSSVRDMLVHVHGWGMAAATRKVQKWDSRLTRWKSQGMSPQDAADRLAYLDKLSEDDHVQEIQSKLETAVDELANESAVESHSTGGDYEFNCVEEQGYDPNDIVIIASAGDEYAVNGDLLVIKHWEQELGLDPLPHPGMGTWAERGKGKYHAAAILERWLLDHGYSVVRRCGGLLPDSEHYATGEFAVERVAKKMALPVDEVDEAAEALDWWDEEIPRSMSVDIDVWAKKTATNED